MNKLDIYRNDNYTLNDAFDQAVMNIHIQHEQNNYKSYVICGCEAGDGTTTVAINLAAALANSGWRTVLVDGDMRKKNRYKRLNEGTGYGMSNYLVDDKGLEDIVYETTTDKLFYIPCGDFINNPVRSLCSAKMDKLKAELDQEFDYVIYDMPAVNAAMDAKVLAVKMDATVLVTAVGETSKRELLTAANTLADADVNLIGTIINKAPMDEYRRHRKDFDYFKKERYAKKSEKSKKSSSIH